MNKTLKILLSITVLFCVNPWAQAAGYYAGCEEDPVTLECPFNGLHVTGRYLYVQPTGDQLFSNLTNTSTFGDGFFLAFGYHFGNDNDLTMNWTFFKADTKRILVPAVPNVITSQFSNERSDDRLHSVNLEFGQTSQWGESVVVRFHTDLNYTHISRGRIFLAQQYQYQQRFNGAGPRVGLDLDYFIGGSGLALVGQANVAVLIGESKLSGASFIPNEDDVVQVTTLSSLTRIAIPVFEWRAGLEYVFELSTGYLSIQGGYQVASYLQALQHTNFIQAPALGGSLFGDQNNFGYQGFYIGLRWEGDWV